MFTLYDYFRSSASLRVRIALNLKGCQYEQIPIHLRRGGGEHLAFEYLSLNPQGLVPTLVDGSHVVTQSLAIIEYLEEIRPEPALLPSDAVGRSYVRAISLSIACDIHPLNNLRVLSYLRDRIGVAQDSVDEWYRHWVEDGFRGIEAILNSRNGHAFATSATPSMADICLVPQVYNAYRFNVNMGRFPRISDVYERCLAIDAFADAMPENQPDAE